PRVDRRVARLAEALRDPTADRAELVRAAGASPSHLRELFARDVGLTMRAFQLWHRLLVGLVSFSQVGATSAAHEVGFADLAHFSRTCRRMLGASPTGLARGLIGR